MSNPITECHKVEAVVVGGDEGTNHYECPVCHDAVNFDGSNPNKGYKMIDETLDNFYDKALNDNWERAKSQALTAIYEIGLECIGADLAELPYDGLPETEMKNADIRAVNRSKASQRKAWAKACGVAEK